MKLINWDKAKWGDGNARGETFKEPSLTVPGQTLSLRDLLDRYVRGGEVATFNPVYTGEEEDYPDLERMSEMDRIDYANELKAYIEDERVKIVKRRGAKKEEEKKEEEQKE